MVATVKKAPCKASEFPIGSVLRLKSLQVNQAYKTCGSMYNPPPEWLKEGDFCTYLSAGFGNNYITVSNVKGLNMVISDSSLFEKPSKASLRDYVGVYLENTKSCPVGKGYGSFGNDPEVFVLDENGIVIPAFTFLPHKDSASYEDATEFVKLQGSDQPERTGRKVFYDGFQAEFTCPAHTCFGYGCDYVRYGLKSVIEKARAVNPKARLTYAPVVDIPMDLLANSPQEGVALGCDPSKNAYTGTENPALSNLDPFTLPFRFAGFHVHFGYGKKPESFNRRVVRALDAIAGVVSVALFQGMEDPRRRAFYGLAGEYRTPEHGMEWRVLSSCVMVHPGIYHLMADITRISGCLAQSRWDHLWISKPDRVRDIINTLNVEEARKLLTENEKCLRLILSAPYGKDSIATNNAIRIIHEGVKNHLPLDMFQNWRLGDSWRNHSNRDQAFWSKVSM